MAVIRFLDFGVHTFRIEATKSYTRRPWGATACCYARSVQARPNQEQATDGKDKQAKQSPPSATRHSTKKERWFEPKLPPPSEDKTVNSKLSASRASSATSSCQALEHPPCHALRVGVRPQELTGMCSLLRRFSLFANREEGHPCHGWGWAMQLLRSRRSVRTTKDVVMRCLGMTASTQCECAASFEHSCIRHDCVIPCAVCSGGGFGHHEVHRHVRLVRRVKSFDEH